MYEIFTLMSGREDDQGNTGEPLDSCEGPQPDDTELKQCPWSGHVISSGALSSVGRGCSQRDMQMNSLEVGHLPG